MIKFLPVSVVLAWYCSGKGPVKYVKPGSSLVCRIFNLFLVGKGFFFVVKKEFECQNLNGIFPL